MKPMGYSPRILPDDGPGSNVFNSDLAFWGQTAYQGHYAGFRIIDISSPAKPREIIDYEDCVSPTSTAGNQGDVIIWEHILVRSWNSPAPAGAACGGMTVPQGQEGVHIFDVSDPRNPEVLAFIPMECGSHTATGVPDVDNNRLLVYSSASSGACPGIDIVEVPLDAPQNATYLRFEQAGRACHDTGVILGDAMLAACAGHGGFTVWSLDPADGGSLENPAFLYERMVEGVTIGHSAAFSWDGEILVFGHEPGGGGQAQCQATSDEVNRTLFFFDAQTGVELGRFVHPRPQTATENCTWHNFNVVPTDKGHILVSGNYQSGISVVDFTDPSNPVEIAYADPAPLSDERLMIGGDWSSYWYNGFIYESDIRRGLIVWRLNDSRVAGARRLSHLNPQTQEMTFEVRAPEREELTGSFELVGHNSLMDRGMNAALAIHGDYAYIGSRTDAGHPEEEYAGGIMIVDISDPTNPTIAGRMLPPDTGNPGESSRELRVWPQQDILIVLHTNCGGPGAHNCTAGSRNNFRFFDISGENATNPQLITELDQATHEFFLWVDPDDPDRALMFGGSAGSNTTAFSVWDISPVARGEQPITVYRSRHGYSRVPAFPEPVEIPTGGLHSLTLNNAGTEAYFALLTGGFAVVDVSDFTAGVENPELRLITENENRPVWEGPGTHSAVKLFGRDWVYASDEVYGSATAPGHGCPWGWARMIDISDPTDPTVESQFRLAPNYEFNCDEWEPRPRTSYSAHNPTATPNVVLTTWHSGGMQAISVENPYYPYQLAEFMPDPVPDVQMEDPRLSSDPDTGRGEKVVMWSFPIVKDGLIYVVDLRNGLYILEYDGPNEEEIDTITFLEGNSNLGHALCFEPVGTPPAYCD